MSQPSFDLIDQPWIPCVDLDGQPRMLGIGETLIRAHELREIFDDSPLVTVTLHRLLLAVVHHMVQGPRDPDHWAAIWKDGTGGFERTEVDEYFAAADRRRRFDLFDADYPFYQSADLPFAEAAQGGKKGRDFAAPVSRLAIEQASGSNVTLFDHSVDTNPKPVGAGEAARLLVAMMGFSVGGTITFIDKKDRSAKACPLVKGAIAVVRGDSLFQTLALNLHQLNGGDGEPFEFDESVDCPAWARKDKVVPEGRLPRGYLDYLTWQSRRIRLKPEADGAGATVVRQAVMMKGEFFPDEFQRRGHETMVAFRVKKDTKPNENPFIPIGFQEDRVFWRNSLALYQSIDQLWVRPPMVDWLNRVCLAGHLNRSLVFPLDLYGMSSDQAKILFWRHERFSLPMELIDSAARLIVLKTALDCAEKTRSNLWKAVRRFAQVLVLQDEKKQPGTEQNKDMKNIVQTLGIERSYWERLEEVFQQLLDSLMASPAEDSDRLVEIGESWLDEVHKTARRVFEQSVERAVNSGRSQRAAAVAGRSLNWLLKNHRAELFEPISELAETN